MVRWRVGLQREISSKKKDINEINRVAHTCVSGYRAVFNHKVWMITFIIQLPIPTLINLFLTYFILRMYFKKDLLLLNKNGYSDTNDDSHTIAIIDNKAGRNARC